MAHPVDVHVGQKFKNLRVLRGLTQADVAKSLNISFQQVQKYESGMNRISASKLFEISNILNRPVGYFFEGLEDEKKEADEDDILLNKDVAEAARAYAELPDILKKPARAMLKAVLFYIKRLEADHID